MLVFDRRKHILVYSVADSFECLVEPQISSSCWLFLFFKINLLRDEVQGTVFRNLVANPKCVSPETAMNVCGRAITAFHSLLRMGTPFREASKSATSFDAVAAVSLALTVQPEALTCPDAQNHEGIHIHLLNVMLWRTSTRTGQCSSCASSISW